MICVTSINGINFNSSESGHIFFPGKSAFPWPQNLYLWHYIDSHRGYNNYCLTLSDCVFVPIVLNIYKHNRAYVHSMLIMSDFRISLGRDKNKWELERFSFGLRTVNKRWEKRATFNSP